MDDNAFTKGVGGNSFVSTVFAFVIVVAFLTTVLASLGALTILSVKWFFLVLGGL